MILKSFKSLLGLLILLLASTSLSGEEKIDIWKNQNLKKNNNLEESKDTPSTNIDKGLDYLKKIDKNQKIQIIDEPINTSEEANVFGVYDPENYNFDLNMWSNTKAEDV